METKYKIDDTLYFLVNGEMFEGKVKAISINIHRGFGTSIIYTVETYDGDKKLLEGNVFKSGKECAMAFIEDCLEKIKVELSEEGNIEYVIKVGEEVFNGNI